MTLEKLLGKLRGDYERIGSLIKSLTPYTETATTARKILKDVARMNGKPKRNVWAHTLAGRKHMNKMRKAAAKARRTNGAKETSSTKS